MRRPPRSTLFPDTTLFRSAVVLSNGAGFAAADLGSLVVTAPDQGGESAFLTLTVSTSEGAGTSAVEILSVTASGVAELPAVEATTVLHAHLNTVCPLLRVTKTGDAA